MEKATPVQMRQSLEMSTALKQAMIRFVPIPVMDDVDFARLTGLLHAKLDMIEMQCSPTWTCCGGIELEVDEKCSFCVEGVR